jgi:hypothetical protein
MDLPGGLESSCFRLGRDARRCCCCSFVKSLRDEFDLVATPLLLFIGTPSVCGLSIRDIRLLLVLSGLLFERCKTRPWLLPLTLSFERVPVTPGLGGNFWGDIDEEERSDSVLWLGGDGDDVFNDLPRRSRPMSSTALVQPASSSLFPPSSRERGLLWCGLVLTLGRCSPPTDMLERLVLRRVLVIVSHREAEEDILLDFWL